MLTRAFTIALLVALSSGCLGLAAGKVVPGAKIRHRDGNVSTTTSTFGSDGSETRTTTTRCCVKGEDAGGGSHGGLVAMRFGIGNIEVDDRPAFEDAGGFDARLEYHFSPVPRFGIGASVGWQIEGATREDDEVSRQGFPLMLIGSVVPLRPFIVRVAGIVQPSVTTVDEIATSGTSRGVMIGPGIATQFRGWHFVATVDWQKSWAGEVMTGTGLASYSSEMFLLDIWVVGW